MAIGTTLKISFDAKAVQSGLARMKSSLSSLGGAAKNIAKIGASIAALGGIGAAAITALVVKINSIGEAGIAGDRALQNVAKQMGVFGDEVDKVTDRLIDYADVTARQTGVDGAAIGETQTKLLTFKELAKTAGQLGGAFDRATMAAIDMQQAGFGQAAQNAVQLGKALNDPIKGINSLTRSGITFTAEEKKKIAVMVESGKILQAQNVILSAIETQVGGTARATATASGRIRESWKQVVDAFAEPFSTGFTSLPGQVEGMFPELIEKATKAGNLFANAISDAIQGNFDKFAAAGKLIGDILGAAATAAFQAASTGIVTTTENALRGTLRNTLLPDFAQPIGQKILPNIEGGSFEELFEAQIILRGVAKQVREIAEGAQGLVPGTGGNARYLPPGTPSMFSDANGNPVEVLKRIEINTREGAKM
jgi:hypothetical protein